MTAAIRNHRGPAVADPRRRDRCRRGPARHDRYCGRDGQTRDGSYRGRPAGQCSFRDVPSSKLPGISSSGAYRSILFQPS